MTTLALSLATLGPLKQQNARVTRSEAEPWVAAARQGDLSAFEALYRENVDRVHALCARLCSERGDAEALTQEVFIRAWTKLERFRGDSAFSTWLHRIAVNIALNDRRALSRRAHGRTRGERVEEADSNAGGELNVDLERAIASLPRQARAVFVLHDIEGYRHTEIAELLGLASGTSKSQLHRARRLLREVLR